MTREEVEHLKHNWLCDPCFTLETMDESGEFYDELLIFSNHWKSVWEARMKAEQDAAATRLGSPGNLALGAYVLNLESRLARLEETYCG